MYTIKAHKLPALYGITEPSLHSPSEFFELIEDALRGGLKLLQYRDKNASPSERLSKAERLSRLCKQYSAALVINDDVELALAVGATGVHLGQGDGSIKDARKRTGNAMLIGATCHNRLELAEKAIEDSANYVAFGSFFPTLTKKEAKAADLSILSAAKSRFPTTPIVAIGGISLANAQQVVDAGADTIATARGLFDSEDISARVAQWHALVR